MLTPVGGRLSEAVVVQRELAGAWRALCRAGSIRPDFAPPAGTEGEALRFDGMAAADADRIMTVLDSLAAGALPWQGSVQWTWRDGVSRRSAVSMQRVQFLGTADAHPIVAIEFSVGDASELVPQARAESRDTAIQAAGLGIVEYDPGPRTVHMDLPAAAHHGLAHATHGQLPVDAWLGLFATDDQLALYEVLNEGVRPGETERLAVRLPAVDPKEHRVLELVFRATPSGRRLVGASRDVTAERSREEMRRQKLAAERASQAKSDFMSQVSHELRTPLNAILGFAQLMAMDNQVPLPVVHRDRLDVLQHSGRRLLGLIDQLLQIGKIEQGKRALKPKSVNVRAAVKRCVDALHVMALDRHIEVEVDIHESQNAIVRADPDALEQVLTNLLSNAIKYNREQGRVRVRFRAGEDGEITVDDTGKGLTDSQLGRLFEPFNRLAAAKTQVQGTGLGLVITRQLVQAMGGKLEVWSESGKGSRFSVHLPLGRRARQMATVSMPLDMPSQWDTGNRYSVLYVEDDEVNVVLMDQLFATQPDWDLHTASTGAEGISIARRQQPQLILLDMNLPDMTGAEVFKHLKADRRTREIPCVAVSADALPEQLTRAQAAGFEDYWTKPLDLPVTIGRLKKLLR